MKYLLDTNTVSEPMRARPNAAVLAWLTGQLLTDLAVSVITLGEIERGILKAPDERRQERLSRWYQGRLLPGYAGRILDVTPVVMTVWAGMLDGVRGSGYTPAPMDSLIAATAQAHGLIVVTRNAADFSPLGVRVLNIWE